MDLLLVVNAMLGFFALAIFAWNAYLSSDWRLRLVRTAIALSVGYVGIIYAGALINLVDANIIGVYYLRPAWTMILLCAIALGVVNVHSQIKGADRLQVVEAKLHRASIEIAHLQETVDWLLSQLMGSGVDVPQRMGRKTERIPAVLGIWPQAPVLNIRAEIDAIFRSGVQYEVMDSHVVKSRVLAEVDRLKPTILHVGGHADRDGVALDDGPALLGWWRNLATLYPFGLVVLNACESLEIVDAMKDAGVQAVVGMRREIADTVAIAFVREFYGWLLRGRSVQQAVTLAKMGLSHTDAELIVARGDWSIGKGA